MPQDSRFAPIIRISKICNGREFGGQPGYPGPDIAVIVCMWGPSHADRTHTYHVRGTPVDRTTLSKLDNGRQYRVCVFPGGHWQWVNEGNISSRKFK
jgi:hypothetical protein